MSANTLFVKSETASRNVPATRIKRRLEIASDQEHKRWKPMGIYDTVQTALTEDRFSIYETVKRGLDGFTMRSGNKKIPVLRETLQARFHAAMLNACMPAIFREDLYMRRQTILNRYSLDDIYTRIQVFAARRMGKTFCVCILFATLLLFVPNIKIAAFGTGMRSAEMIVAETWKLVTSMEEVFTEFGNQKNVTRIVLTKGDHGEDTRMLTAYPSSTNVSLAPSP